MGNAMWWPRDPIAGPWVPIVTVVGTLIAACVSLISAFAGSRLLKSVEGYRKTLWIALVAIAAFGPVGLALTPPLVARRMARNEQIAAARLASLQRAAQRTLAAASSPRELCDGSRLRRNYTGRAFSDEDWQRITGNYVKQDGYFFMIYCQEKSGYMIDTNPVRDGQDGTHRFCVDDSGKFGCGMQWNRSRYQCLPCAK